MEFRERDDSRLDLDLMVIDLRIHLQVYDLPLHTVLPSLSEDVGIYRVAEDGAIWRTGRHEFWKNNALILLRLNKSNTCNITYNTRTFQPQRPSYATVITTFNFFTTLSNTIENDKIFYTLDTYWSYSVCHNNSYYPA